MRLPNRLTICGQRWTIRVCKLNPLANGSVVHGICYPPPLRLIQIDRNTDSVADTTLHEIQHAIEFEAKTMYKRLTDERRIHATSRELRAIMKRSKVLTRLWAGKVR